MFCPGIILTLQASPPLPSPPFPPPPVLHMAFFVSFCNNCYDSHVFLCLSLSLCK